MFARDLIKLDSETPPVIVRHCLSFSWLVALSSRRSLFFLSPFPSPAQGPPSLNRPTPELRPHPEPLPHAGAPPPPDPSAPSRSRTTP